MRGSFIAGTPPAPAATPIKLTATVGPGATIALKKGSAAVKRLTRGSYSITVRDRSAAHNFHLTGPGVARKTTVAFTGSVTWKVTVRKGTYRFVCDAHPTSMRGSFTVT
jgi:hypothetical protein